MSLILKQILVYWLIVTYTAETNTENRLSTKHPLQKLTAVVNFMKYIVLTFNPQCFDAHSINNICLTHITTKVPEGQVYWTCGLQATKLPVKLAVYIHDSHIPNGW